MATECSAAAAAQKAGCARRFPRLIPGEVDKQPLLLNERTAVFGNLGSLGSSTVSLEVVHIARVTST